MTHRDAWKGFLILFVVIVLYLIYYRATLERDDLFTPLVWMALIAAAGLYEWRKARKSSGTE